MDKHAKKRKASAVSPNAERSDIKAKARAPLGGMLGAGTRATLGSHGGKGGNAPDRSHRGGRRSS